MNTILDTKNKEKNKMIVERDEIFEKEEHEKIVEVISKNREGD